MWGLLKWKMLECVDLGITLQQPLYDTHTNTHRDTHSEGPKVVIKNKCLWLCVAMEMERREEKQV